MSTPLAHSNSVPEAREDKEQSEQQLGPLQHIKEDLTDREKHQTQEHGTL
jgi:hypothetical protein